MEWSSNNSVIPPTESIDTGLKLVVIICSVTIVSSQYKIIDHH